MTALLGAAILLVGSGSLMYGAQPKRHPGAVAAVRPAGNVLIGLGATIAAVAMFGQMAGITV
ncbi:MAG: hypothetical protein J0J04_07595 [Microbacterium sp.]|uniref:hypothetical protein n=1 Tax=Microbacterium sp. TaxID=51671 RepID=UPI001ACA08A7|nr:hypothetical protein [Microbacterium sp.]MBN9214661.1 hypothetical protein [Microbacterium sp.]